MGSRRLADHVWTDLGASGAARPLLLVPVGSCEQHGPHLPLDTDTVIAEAVARRAAPLLHARLHDVVGDCLVAPSVAIAASGEHADFPGTLSIGTAALVTLLVELVRSADWALAVVIVNGHGGNTAALQQAEAQLAAEGRTTLVWSPAVDGGDLHAGRTETSLMLALDPSRVRAIDVAAGPQPAIAELVERGVRAVSPSGVLGDPRGASAEHGIELLDRMVDDLVASVAARLP